MCLHARQSARRERGARLRPRRRRHATPARQLPDRRHRHRRRPRLAGLGRPGRRPPPASPSTPAATRHPVHGDGDGLKWVRPPLGGTTPISLTYDHVLYVLNSGGAAQHRRLRHPRRQPDPDPGLDQPMGAGATGPAQISFSPTAHVLVVTEKRLELDRRPLRRPRRGGQRRRLRPPRRHAVRLRLRQARQPARPRRPPARPRRTTSARRARERDQRRRRDAPGAPCWLIASKDGRYAYTANAGSGTLSGFSVGNDGALSLLDPSGVTASFGAGSHPLDETVSSNGEYLYNLTDGLHRISGFRSLRTAAWRGRPDRRLAGRRGRDRRFLRVAAAPVASGRRCRSPLWVWARRPSRRAPRGRGRRPPHSPWLPRARVRARAPLAVRAAVRRGGPPPLERERAHASA